jgi:carboxyl-terminal processing protease
MRRTLRAVTMVVLMVVLDPSGSAWTKPQQKADDALQLFERVFQHVRNDYVTKPDDEQLVLNAIKGMLAGLDARSVYYDPKTFREMQAPGEFGGVGLELTMEDGFPKVVSTIEDTPAAKAGMTANDIITMIDGAPVQGLTLNLVVEKLRGPVNARVKLTVARKGLDKPIDFTISREIIRVLSVRWRAQGRDVGYIRITQFNEATFDGLKGALVGLTTKLGTDNLVGYVLDLRNNPGGLLDPAVAVSRAFLDKGEIVALRGREAVDFQRFFANPGGDLIGGKPLIVLINNGTANGAEIVAAALQVNRRATIVGSRSSGTGSIETVIPLGDDYGGLRLTTATYYTASGRAIDGQGIAPDIQVLQDVPQGLNAKPDSYVPVDEKDDKALKLATDLLRGVEKNSSFPPDANGGRRQSR